MYDGFIALSRTVSPVSGGNAFLTPVGFLSEPERLTQYEVGFRQQLGDVAAFTVTGFYKDTRNQLAVRKFADENGNPLYTAYLNNDFGTIKGLEFTLDLRRVQRLSGRLNLTLQNARGTGSNPTSSFGVVERQDIGRFPSFINPLDFNQPMRGTALIDYRFGKGDGGSILQGLGAFALLNFNSGHNYTKIKEPESLGQASPYTIGVRPLIDPRSSFPIESVNASTTPAQFTVDLTVNKLFYFSSFNLEIYANVLNLLNAENKINVFPNTGTTEDDGWLNNPIASEFVKDTQYVDFYRAFNLDNRHAYINATGNDLLGIPRQIRLGLRLEY
jgi:outer membrane receptor protein involved in Fe transport